MNRDVLIRLLVTPAEREAWQAAADKAGLKLSEWIRRRVQGETTIEVPAAPVLVPPSRARQQRNKAAAKQFAAELKKGGK